MADFSQVSIDFLFDTLTSTDLKVLSHILDRSENRIAIAIPTKELALALDITSVSAKLSLRRLFKSGVYIKTSVTNIDKWWINPIVIDGSESIYFKDSKINIKIRN